MRKTKINKNWKLPPPPKVGNTWLPIVKWGRTIPFGYKEDPDDPDQLLPIPKELELLEVAKGHLRQYSLRQVAAWLSEESGRYISHVGLEQRIKLEQRRARDLSLSKYWAKRAEKAAAKAKEIEKKYLTGVGASEERNASYSEDT